ncbi:MAG: F0F1 ATP synthase subunit delta [Actinomycetaceae bacterium]|nr:F0F1 ATP synthase subunit delta [Actinomycetaceae bacterium]
MRASSAAALEAAQEKLRELIPENWQQLDAVAEGFMSLGELARSQPRISRALTDPARTSQDKVKLADELLGDDFPQATKAGVRALAQARWSAAEDFEAALFDLGILTQLYAVAAANAVDQVSDELLEVRHLLESTRELRLALSDRNAPVHQRIDIAKTVLQGQVHAGTIALISDIMREGRSLLSALAQTANRAAALNGRTLVTAEAAQDLSEAQRQRLCHILEQRYNSEIDLNIQVRPELLGGIRIKTAKHITDGTIRTALARAKSSLAV